VSKQNRAFLWYRLAILSSTISNIHCSDDTYIASNLTSSVKDNSKVISHCRQYNIGNIDLINYYGNIMATAWILNLLRALVGKLLSKKLWYFEDINLATNADSIAIILIAIMHDLPATTQTRCCLCDSESIYVSQCAI